MGMYTQLLIALEYKTGTKLMRRQSSSTLPKYVNYLIVISININENYSSKRKFAKKKNKNKKTGGYTHISEFFYLVVVLHSND